MTSMPRVDDDVIRQRVTSASFLRGRDYADLGAVLDVEWDGGELTATVAGSLPAPYRCRITLVKLGTLWIPMQMGCTCPVRTGCKHAVAALITAREEANRPEIGPDWRASLALAQPGPLPPPLGLGFYLAPEVGPSTWQSRMQPALTPVEAFEQGKRLELMIRPMTKGKTDAWIRGGLTWRGLTYDVTFDREQSLALRQILGVYDATRRSSGGVDHEGLAVHEIAGAGFWQLLRHAIDAGVVLVPERGIRLEVGQSARVWVEVERQGDDLAVASRVEIDGEGVQGPWFPIGDHGVYTYARTESGFSVRLAPTTAPIALPTLTAPEPVTIPGEDEDEFFAEVYPRLRRKAEVTSSSIDLPEVKPPALQLTVTYRDKDRLSLEWAWNYFEPPASYPVEPYELPEFEAGRDLAWESETLEGLREAWPLWSIFDEFEGVEAAEFSAEILPVLQDLPGLTVEIVGSQPSYTKLEGYPHIKVTTVETDRTDWFDLGFEITINGRLIPYAVLFAALSRGQKKLLLVDKSYLSLDHEAFDELKELLARAEELPEWDPVDPKISRYQVHFWEEFEDLAHETAPAVAWREAIAGLRNIDDIEPVPTPPELKAELRPYQRDGLTWLAFLQRNNLGGILADDMGLGKTLQTLALISHAPPEKDPYLIIAPTSVVSTWVSEAKKFAPHLVTHAVTKTKAARRKPLDVTGADIVVTSYAIARLDAAEFHAREWAGLVLDEAQFVKNARTRLHQAVKEIPAPFRLALTGTPMENSLTDLHSLMAITAPGLFPSAREFRERYVKAIEKDHDPERLARLRSLIRPFMLRRTKELVAPELPEKQEQVLEVELTAAHRKIYDATMQRERQKVLRLIDDLDRNRMIVFRSLTLLRMLVLAPGLIDEEFAQIESAKLTSLMNHVREIAAEGHRVLVFSQFTSFLKLAAQECEKEGVAYEYLDGSTRSRAKVIDSFRNGDAPVFFISLKAGGFGLTLTEADYVFVLDPWWNPAAESQAVDRTHRIGQTRKVNVYRMVAPGTIEEKVLALQRKKAALFDAVVDDDAHFSRALTASDIRGLFDA